MKTQIRFLLILVFLLNQAYAQSAAELIKRAMDSLYQSPSNGWIVTDQYSEKETGLTHAYVQQIYHGIPVYNAISVLAIKNNKTVYHKSTFVEAIKTKVTTEKPIVTPRQAIDFALKHLGLSTDPSIREKENQAVDNKHLFDGGGIAKSPIKVDLVFVSVSGKVLLAWNVSLNLKKQSNWWNVRVDALTGDFIQKNDYIAHCNFDPITADEDNGGTTSVQAPSSSLLPPPSSSYNVFPLPLEAPTFGPRVILTNPADPIASPFGWHDVDGVAGAEYTITRGNNVYSYEDQDNDDLPGYSPNGGAGLSFNFPFNINSQPLTNEDAALTNLFYVNNAIHDKLYTLGFSEPEGNFQANNYGHGGEENDNVLAEGFDGSGTDNANFGTPPDGANPRMQMYTWAGFACGNFTINSPASIAGSMLFGSAGFNPSTASTTGNLVLVNDGTPLFTEGCSPIVNNIMGKIAVIDRGTCSFLQKVTNAQNAGATGVIIVNNGPGVSNMGGFDPNIFIPSVMVSQSDGAILKNKMLLGPVNATINICPNTKTDSNFDNGVIVHEYGHGVSNRLTGGPSNTGCLFNGEQGGEGWSDWLALMLTIETGDQGTNPRAIGTYVEGQTVNGSGIRTYPYSTDMNIDPHTYADLAINPEVHYIGEIWCSAIWDLSWALIDQYGYNANPTVTTAGNNIAIRLILEGMKLQVCGPGFLDSRDGILMADHVLYNDAHRCMIWQVFARRGMGYNAQQGSADFAGDETADFTLPPTVQPFATGGGSFCLPGNAVLDAGSGWLSYDWGNGNHNQTFVPSQFGTYTVTVTGLGCNNTVVSGTASVTIKQSFDPVTTATPASVCPNGSSQLDVIGDAQLGNGALTNTIYSSPAPYGNVWTSHHEQYLILASELQAQGMLAGNITSLAFDVVSHNSGPGSQNLIISLAHSNVTDLTNTFISTGFSQVYSTPYFTSAEGWNTHSFSSPFNWNGTSNILVDITLMNCQTCPVTACIDYYLNDVVNQSATSFNSCTYSFDDNNCSVPSFTPTSAVFKIKQRPNMLLTGVHQPPTYSWSPATFLSSTSIQNPVANNITSSISYNVLVTKQNGCYGTASQSVEITAPPAPPAILGRTAVCKGESGITYCVEELPGILSYIWTLPTGVTGTSTTNCITVNFSTKFNGGDICVKAVNGCFTGIPGCLTLTVQKYKPARPGFISGQTPVCLPYPTNYYFYSINPVPNADTYLWAVTGNGGTSPMNIAYDGGTFVYLDISSGYNGNQSLTVKASNCKGLSPERKMDIKKLPVPTTPGTITGPAAVCKNSTKTYSVNNVSNTAYYAWSVTGGATIFSGYGTNTVKVKFNTATSSSADLSVITVNDCGHSSPRIKTISVNLGCKLSDLDSDDDAVTFGNAFAFTAYPNPTPGKITVSFNTDSKAKFTLKVIDLLNKSLVTTTIESIEGLNLKEIDLSHVAKGMYFLSIETEGREVETMRIVVE